MRFYEASKIVAIFLIFSTLSMVLPSSAKADLFFPPTELLTTPLSLGLFLGNFIINFALFGLGYNFFVEAKIFEVIKKKPFIVTILLITLLGFVSDSVAYTLVALNITYFIVFPILAFLIFASNYIVCKYYLKLAQKQAIKLGIWMGIVTNPFSYFVLAFILSFFLIPFT